MAVTVPPGGFVSLTGNGGGKFAATKPIDSDGWTVAIDCATAAYAQANRRALLSWGQLGAISDGSVAEQPITVLNAEGTVALFDVRVTCSVDTDKLSMAATVNALPISIVIKNAATMATIDTLSFTPSGPGDEFATDTSTSLGGVTDLVLEVSASSATTGYLYRLRVLEDDLTAGDLP